MLGVLLALRARLAKNFPREIRCHQIAHVDFHARRPLGRQSTGPFSAEDLLRACKSFDTALRADG